MAFDLRSQALKKANKQNLAHAVLCENALKKGVALRSCFLDEQRLANFTPPKKVVELSPQDYIATFNQ